ncbi:Phosphoinositide phosphatase SAC7 [Nosema granulosis]|uniref:Phosphoinositide phosphatase SAC7 n=1 Tax=Nosema granulosis TaxID=83296 RepID=A0A9P6KYX9_9MICR|nr:Phosphoinositide phosphatase SAC7 [Nosema granulosis]
MEIEISKKKIVLFKERTNKIIINSDIDYEDKTILSYGLYGIVEIENVKFMLSVSKINKRTSIKGHEVYEIADVEIIQLNGKVFDFNLQRDDIKSFFYKPGIYFSSFPLYKNQSMNNIENENDFLFNFKPLEKLREVNPELSQFGINCIEGFYDLQNINGMYIGLISRRSWKRVGVRYFSRGSDAEGYCSNYVETELLLSYGYQELSFLQVRGSIPLVWSHIVTLSYTPKLLLGKESFLEKCHEVLKEKYSEVFYLNLIRKKGYEEPICKKFTESLKAKDYKYLHFDVHGSGPFEDPNVQQTLLDNIKPILDEFSFKKHDLYQSGVVRTNCIDCLDRTNLCQFIISHYMLEKMLLEIGIINSQEIANMHRSMWYNNGNNLSLQYAGTSALKSYVVRGDARNSLGCLEDFLKSLKRYYINRQTHGRLQNTYEVLTGGNPKERKKTKRPGFLSPCMLFFMTILIGIFSVSKFYSLRGIQMTAFAIFFLILDFNHQIDYPEYEDSIKESCH